MKKHTTNNNANTNTTKQGGNKTNSKPEEAKMDKNQENAARNINAVRKDYEAYKAANNRPELTLEEYFQLEEKWAAEKGREEIEEPASEEPKAEEKPKGFYRRNKKWVLGGAAAAVVGGAAAVGYFVFDIGRKVAEVAE